jgi:hypothetical protein
MSYRPLDRVLPRQELLRRCACFASWLTIFPIPFDLPPHLVENLGAYFGEARSTAGDRSNR